MNESATPVSNEMIATAMRACITSERVPTGVRPDLVNPDGVYVIRGRVDLEDVAEVMLEAVVAEVMLEAVVAAILEKSAKAVTQ